MIAPSLRRTLPPPDVTFSPSQSPTEPCNTNDSTSVQFEYSVPLTGRRAIHYYVMQHFYFCAGGNCSYDDTRNIGELWIHPGLHIVDADASSSEIESSSWERSIGQRVNVQASTPFDNDVLSACSWNVPNGAAPYAVGGYGQYAGNPSSMVSPSPMPSLSNAGLTFYWTQPFDASQMNVTCTATNSGGIGDGGPLTMEISAVLNPNVVAPTFSISSAFGAIHHGDYSGTVPGSEEVSFGTQAAMPDSLGMQATFSVTAPSDYGGSFGPNQTDNGITVVSPAPSVSPSTTNGQNYLDGCSIDTEYYNSGDSSIDMAAVHSETKDHGGTFSFVDAPASADYSGYQSIQETDNFITTLMFKPTTDAKGDTIANSIWVPLMSFAWGLDATDVFNGTSWAWATSPAPTQYPSTGTYTSASNTERFTTYPSFPTWQGHLLPPMSCPSPIP
jgi:hypothetical protein